MELSAEHRLLCSCDIPCIIWNREQTWGKTNKTYPPHRSCWCRLRSGKKKRNKKLQECCSVFRIPCSVPKQPSIISSFRSRPIVDAWGRRQNANLSANFPCFRGRQSISSSVLPSLPQSVSVLDSGSEGGDFHRIFLLLFSSVLG